MNIQVQNYNNSLISNNELIAPIGDNFTNPTTQTKYPYKGAIGYDEGSQLLYYGNGVEWLLAGVTGSTGMGATGSTGRSATGLTGQTGIQGPTGQMGVASNTGSTGQAGQYTATAPITATDSNGIIVNNSGDTLGLEFVDLTHNGIVSTVAQNMAGPKTFQDGILLGNMNGGIGGPMFTEYNTPTFIELLRVI
jgi:hypothetical protein